METILRSCILSVIAMLMYSQVFAQTVSTTLNGATSVQTDMQTPFNVVITKGSAAANTMVKGRFVFTNQEIPYKASSIQLEYKDGDTWKPVSVGKDGIATFGGDNGFALEDKTMNLRVTFGAAGIYNYRIELVPAAGGDAIASATETVSVNAVEEALINSTLDVVENPVTDQQIVFDVFIYPHDRMGDLAKVVFTLNNPEQRNSISNVQVATNASGSETQTLTFDEQGKLVYGPANGFPLPAADTLVNFRFTFSQAGTYGYKLSLVREDGTVLASVDEAVTVALVNGVDDMISDSRISLYPTVSNGQVKLDLGKVRNAKVAVTDMLGRVVAEISSASGSIVLDTNRFAKGTYVVKVIKDSDVAACRFLVR